MATRVQELQVAEEGVLLGKDILQEARLGQHVRVVVHEGEIRLLPAEEAWNKTLDELAGCLGEESAEEYDFKLKVGGLYEAR